MKIILKLLCILLVLLPGKLPAQDVLPNFNRWIQENTSSKMEFYQIQNGTLAVVKATADSDLYQVRKKSYLFFWSNNGDEAATPHHAYYRLFPKTNEPTSWKTDVISIMPDYSGCKAEIKLRFNKNKTISLSHDDLTVTLKRNKKINKADCSYFHPTRPALHKSFWKLDDHRYMVIINDPTNIQNLAILQGDTDFIETIAVNFITKIDDNYYQIKTANTEFLFYPGHRLKIACADQSKKNLWSLLHTRPAPIVLALLKSIYPETVQAYGHHPCALFSQSGRIFLPSHRIEYTFGQKQ